jgi:enamine deaminase RidA (YjgF/YER057c/UK114 family)
MSTPSSFPGSAGKAAIHKRAVSNPNAIIEAYVDPKPAAYSRGMRIDVNGLTILFLSGTFSVDEQGNTMHANDFRGQMLRVLDTITGLLASEGCTWHDIVRTTCYLRDIERDYDLFNEIRTSFYRKQKLDPLPASTAIQATLCRPDFLVEIEAIAMFQTNGAGRIDAAETNPAA